MENASELVNEEKKQEKKHAKNDRHAVASHGGAQRPVSGRIIGDDILAIIQFDAGSKLFGHLRPVQIILICLQHDSARIKHHSRPA